MKFTKTIKFFFVFLTSVLSLYYFSGLYVIAFSRLDYIFLNGPYEDASLQMAKRILAGLPLYGEITVEFIPMIYGPALFYLIAFFSWLLEPTLLATRLPSLISLVLLPLALYKIFSNIETGTDTNRRSITLLTFWTAIFTTGLFFSNFKDSDYWLDLAKVDSLFILLISTSVSIYLSILNKKPKFHRLTLLGIVSGTLFFVKQSGLAFFIFFVIIVLIIYGFRKALITGISGLVVIIIPSMMLEMQQGNYFLHYTVDVPAKHPFWTAGLYRELFDVVGPTGIASIFLMILEGVWIIQSIKGQLVGKNFIDKLELLRNHDSLRNFISFLGIIATGFVISYVGRHKVGATTNSFLYVLLCNSLVIARFAYLSKNDILFTQHWAERYRSKGNNIIILVIGSLVLLQFVNGYYNVGRKLENIRQMKSIEIRHKEDLCSLSGNPVIFHATILPNIHCGKREFFVYPSAIDIMNDQRNFELLAGKLKTAVMNNEISMVMADTDTFFSLELLERMIAMVNMQIGRTSSQKEIRKLESYKKNLELSQFFFSRFEIVGPDRLTREEIEFLTDEQFITGKLLFILKPIHETRN